MTYNSIEEIEKLDQRDVFIFDNRCFKVNKLLFSGSLYLKDIGFYLTLLRIINIGKFLEKYNCYKEDTHFDDIIVFDTSEDLVIFLKDLNILWKKNVI